MDGSENDVLVIGSGVAGLTSAISLAEAGLRVAIRTAAPPEATTSAVAGAVWGPVNVRPAGRVREWARIGLETLRSLESDPLDRHQVPVRARAFPGTRRPAGMGRPPG